MRIIKPKRLKPGSTIGIVAPASPASEEATEKSITYINQMGYNVKIGKSVGRTRGYLAGDDTLRAKDLMDMFEDKEVDGIICLRGGYGSARILDKIDYRIIKKHPKIFIGYSDITSLHIAIHQKTGLITFHGPMPASDMTEGLDDISLQYFIESINGSNSKLEIVNPCKDNLEVLVEGRAKGSIIGGNLSIIASTLGTPYEIKTKGRILFLEDIGEEPYRIDRMLTQLKLSGKLDEAEGIILCSWTDCIAKQEEKSLTLSEVFSDIIVPCNKPALFGYNIGHCIPNITVPIGVKSCIDTYTKSFSICEAAAD